MKYLPLANSNKFIMVSDRDFSRLSKQNWSLTSDGYPITAVRGRCIGIGPFILGRNNERIVDHKDGNPLNNMRRNLRICSPSQSAMNRRGWDKKTIPYKGVHFDRKRNKYRAIVTANGVRRIFPRRETPLEAARDYDKAARELHGKFARTNFA